MRSDDPAINLVAQRLGADKAGDASPSDRDTDDSGRRDRKTTTQTQPPTRRRDQPPADSREEDNHVSKWLKSDTIKKDADDFEAAWEGAKKDEEERERLVRLLLADKDSALILGELKHRVHLQVEAVRTKLGLTAVLPATPGAPAPTTSANGTAAAVTAAAERKPVDGEPHPTNPDLRWHGNKWVSKEIYDRRHSGFLSHFKRR